MSNFWGQFFMFCGAKKIKTFLKNCSVPTKKLHKIKFKKHFFFLKSIRYTWFLNRNCHVKMIIIHHFSVFIWVKFSFSEKTMKICFKRPKHEEDWANFLPFSEKPYFTNVAKCQGSCWLMPCPSMGPN